MGFFNFIETFFFLSLGITFVLILLLVYHFKQRLTTLENKCDTVFEIISNLVKEVSNIKQVQISQYAMTSSNLQNSNTIIPSEVTITKSIWENSSFSFFIIKS